MALVTETTTATAKAEIAQPVRTPESPLSHDRAYVVAAAVIRIQAINDRLSDTAYAASEAGQRDAATRDRIQGKVQNIAAMALLPREERAQAMGDIQVNLDSAGALVVGYQGTSTAVSEAVNVQEITDSLTEKDSELAPAQEAQVQDAIAEARVTIVAATVALETLSLEDIHATLNNVRRLMISLPAGQAREQLESLYRQLVQVESKKMETLPEDEFEEPRRIAA